MDPRNWREPTMLNWVVHGTVYLGIYMEGSLFLPRSLVSFSLFPLPLPLSHIATYSPTSPNLVSSHHSLLHLQKFPYVYRHLARICSESFSLHVNSLGFQRACLPPPSRSDFITSVPLCSLLSLSLVLFLFHF